jgi:putative membrane protein
MPDLGNFVPYCGSPPGPGTVAWNFDPVLIATLAAFAAIHGWGVLAYPAIGQSAIGRNRKIAFHAGLAVLAAAMMSPLCNLGVALFSARVAQHMIVTLVAAPLLILGRADWLIRSLFSWPSRHRSAMPSGWMRLGAPAVFAMTLWFWHLAGPYDAALRNNVVYWAMDVSLFASSLFLWSRLLGDADHRPGDSLVASLFTGFQMCLLGALLTLSRHAWFAAHAETTWPWGLSPIEDQNLGGLIMWVPGGILIAGFTVFLLGRLLGLETGHLRRTDLGALRE